MIGPQTVLTCALLFLFGAVLGFATATHLANGHEVARMVEIEGLNALTRAQERTHDQEVSKLAADYAARATAARVEDARVVAGLRAGEQRMRLRASRCEADSGAASASPGGADGTGTAELAPATSAALYSLAADGDRAASKLTALQAWARSAVKLCGEVRE